VRYIKKASSLEAHREVISARSDLGKEQKSDSRVNKGHVDPWSTEKIAQHPGRA
jgi:hypothetical protein